MNIDIAKLAEESVSDIDVDSAIAQRKEQD